MTRRHADAPAGVGGWGTRGRPVPATPGRLGRRSWWQVLKRTVAEFRTDNLTDWAAALTYYGILSIFPALLALVSILGLLGSSAIQPLLDNLAGVAPGTVRQGLTTVLESLQSQPTGASIGFIVGLALALWSASGYVVAFMRASNAVYDMPEGRPVWKTLPVRIGVTVVLVVLLAISAVAVVFTGGLARRAGSVLGVGPTAITAWDIAKWPALIVLVAVMLSILYWAAPNVKHPGFRWITPGGVLAVLIWMAASAAFAVYITNFASYSKTYGSLAAVIIFLVWLWITNIAVLLGAEFDAELQRERAIVGGHPVEREPYAEPRDTRKMAPPETP
ncbi:MAG: YihY/virulence factor BrkB family protein [Carbonactinosporaceae bacterium]